MAITDNTFAPEELTAAIAANPTLIPHLVGAVKSSGYIARTADEENKFIGDKTKELYDGLDKDLFDTSGVAKNPTEKTYDYAKRVVGGLKTSLTEATTPLQTKIAELEKQIKDGNGNETLKAQLEQLQEKEKKYQEDITDRDTKLFQKDVMLDIRDGLRAVELNKTLPESLRKLAVNDATNAIVGMAKLQKNADGTESVVYIRDNKVALNKDGQPATAADLLQELLKDVIEAGQLGAGGGAGAGGTGGASGGGRKAVPTSLPATVKTQGQLHDYLKEYGLIADTEEYDKAWDALKGDTLSLR